MDNALAHEGLDGVLKVIDRWGFLYEHRWGYATPMRLKTPHSSARSTKASTGSANVQVASGFCSASQIGQRPRDRKCYKFA
jgi:hypothetical protein